jgi:hypothetical protein
MYQNIFQTYIHIYVAHLNEIFDGFLCFRFDRKRVAGLAYPFSYLVIPVTWKKEQSLHVIQNMYININ